jgi:Ser/Thr protein kinase RdoA (MazF antagonist)
MGMTTQHDIKLISQHFQIRGAFQSAEPYGSGHINDTYCAVYNHEGTSIRYIHQRINHNVFKNPAALMENVQRVTTHVRTKLEGQPDSGRRTLTLVLARDGQPLYRDVLGNYWRTYIFVEKAHTYDAAESPQQAFEAAKAFGRFQQLLSDLPAPRLHETIPGFHDTSKRFEALLKAIEADSKNRAEQARAEINFALQHAGLARALLDARLPERITHNDTKFNNVMLDDDTGKGICVVDLDTVMPGLALYDFGDQVRTTTSPTKEDEIDLSGVRMQMPMFEALVRGYLSEAEAFLTKAERQCLAFSGKLITFEVGIRFLTDFLSGDTYFKVHREGHNLDRCRTQFKLVESIEQQEEQMNRVVEFV